MARLTILDFLKDKWGSVPPVVNSDLAGKNVLVIGANTGLGLEAAKHFASMNPARLFLGCRNQAKGEAAVEGMVRLCCPYLSLIVFKEIEKVTGYHNMTLWLVDLSNFSSVVEFAEKFETEDIKLDIVVANAGVVCNVYETSPEGWEQWYAFNIFRIAFVHSVLMQLASEPSLDIAVVYLASPENAEGRFRGFNT